MNFYELNKLNVQANSIDFEMFCELMNKPETDYWVQGQFEKFRQAPVQHLVNTGNESLFNEILSAYSEN
jgi:hypothetical protein